MLLTFSRAVLVVSVLASLSGFAAPALAEGPPVVLVFLADSNLNGAGIDRGTLTKSEEFGAQLQEALSAAGVPVKITSPGWKEFSEDGANWIRRAPAAADMLAAPDGFAVMLELGANDCSDYSLDETRANLEIILTGLQSSHVPVLIVGTTAGEICKLVRGPVYPAEYAEMYADLAKKYGALYYPDFLEGVTGHPELLQRDAEHANSEGNALIVAKMLPVVKELASRAIRPKS